MGGGFFISVFTGLSIAIKKPPVKQSRAAAREFILQHLLSNQWKKQEIIHVGVKGAGWGNARLGGNAGRQTGGGCGGRRRIGESCGNGKSGWQSGCWAASKQIGGNPERIITHRILSGDMN